MNARSIRVIVLGVALLAAAATLVVVRGTGSSLTTISNTGALPMVVRLETPGDGAAATVSLLEPGMRFDTRLRADVVLAVSLGREELADAARWRLRPSGARGGKIELAVDATGVTITTTGVEAAPLDPS